jgi:antitoxin (DNA-binding transcriptional repressor) of toxin-antitoxin stability system
MSTVTLEEAQAKLPRLIHDLAPGAEVVITENNQPVAKLVSENPPSASSRLRSGVVSGTALAAGGVWNRRLAPCRSLIPSQFLALKHLGEPSCFSRGSRMCLYRRPLRMAQSASSFNRTP